MNSVVMSIRGLPSLELWVPTLPVVPVSSGGSSGSGDSEIVGFDWSYQSWIWKWYFVTFVTRKESYCLKCLRLSSLGGAHVETQHPERDTKEF